MDTGGAGWGLQTIIGGAILIIVILWAVFRNRASRGSVDKTEQATHELYDEENANRDRSGDGTI